MVDRDVVVRCGQSKMLRPGTMFVADKEGKRISAHDKLRLYEPQPQDHQVILKCILKTKCS